MKRTALLPVALLSLEVSPAMAHAGDSISLSLSAGLLHPLTGSDHLVAALAVGIWAFMLGSRALFFVPGAFMVAMITGSLVAALGYQLPLFEAGIIASVFALGALVVLDVKLPNVIAAMIAAGFALMHGFAHGVEMPVGMAVVPHVIGFTVTTLVLMASGALGAFAITRFAGSLAPRVLGIGALTAGVALLAAH